MTLTRCPHCESEVSPSALICRTCNRRLDEVKGAESPPGLSGAPKPVVSVEVQPPARLTSWMTVSVVDVSIPFWSMVAILVQLVFAAIPALILLSIFAGVVGVLFMAFLSAWSHGTL